MALKNRELAKDVSEVIMVLFPPSRINYWVMGVEKYLPVEVKMPLFAFGHSALQENVASKL